MKIANTSCPPVRPMVREEVWAFMSSYKRINGVYANENCHLLQEILRDEWGFDGFVVSDWGGSNEHIEGVRAGSHLEMPTTGGDSDLELVQAVRDEKLSVSLLDSVYRKYMESARHYLAY